MIDATPVADEPTSPCPSCAATTRRTINVNIYQCNSCGWISVGAPSPHPTADHTSLLSAEIAPDGVVRERYRLVARLGEGAHGVSYLARHEFLRHDCVVKILAHAVTTDSDAAARRLRNEARAGFRVNHPLVVRVLDCDQIAGAWFFVMEFAAGIDLERILATRAAWSWKQVVRVAVDAAEGLRAIHDASLVHRDLKPSNLILCCDGRLKIADLGVAAVDESRGGADLDPIEVVAGTIGFLAPETLEAGRRFDRRSDVYALGAVLHQLLLGRPPFSHGGVLQRLVDQQNRDVEWPARERSDVPAALSAIVTRCLRSDPDARYASADELLDALQHAFPAQFSAQAPAQPEPWKSPRGIGVLPFENSGGDASDDWLGDVVAEYVAARLSELHGAYVAPRDNLRRIVGDARRHTPDFLVRLRDAGRLVGAAQIVIGRFRRESGEVELAADVYQQESGAQVEAGTVRGPLSNLVALQSALLARIAAALGLDVGVPPTPAPAAPQIALAAQAEYVRAREAFLKGDYQAAVTLAQRASELDARFAEPFGFIGACCARQGRYEQAEAWHRRLDAAAQERGDLRMHMEATANIGLMYYFKGEYDAAHRHCADAVASARRLGLPAELADINNNLGFVLLRLGRLAEAEVAFHESIDTHQAYGALASLVSPYNGLGTVLIELQRPADAQRYFKLALDVAYEIGDRVKIGVSHLNLGRCASLSGDFETAKNEFTLAFNALEETRFWNGLTRAYDYVAEMNLRLHDYREALRCADKSIELARLHANRSMEAAGWRHRAAALAALEQPAESSAAAATAARLESSTSESANAQ